MIDKRIIFLERFLKFYEINNIEIVEIQHDKIFGFSVFPEEDLEVQKQEFVWEITEDEILPEKSLELMKIIQENKFHKNDKIIVDSQSLFKKTGWNDLNEFEEMFSGLFKVDIRMVDNGEKTDSYFLHT